MVTNTGKYSITAPAMHNVACVLYFLAHSEDSEIKWALDKWKGRTILNVIEWTENSEYKWAIHIDLDNLGYPGEEAILPFSWYNKRKPFLYEGITAWRYYYNGSEE